MISCQSCGIPIGHPKNFGTETNKSKCGDYCIRCYKNGQFVEPGLALGEMEFRVQKFLQDELGYDESSVVEIVRSLPDLARWRPKV